MDPRETGDRLPVGESAAGSRARTPRSLLLPVLGGIVVLAWIALWWLEQTPIGGLFHQHDIGGHGSHDQSGAWLHAGAFLVGWLLMTVAMMLPTTVPLVRLFRRMVEDHATASLLVTLLLAGYLAAWLVFGLVALGLTWGVNRILSIQTAWLWGATLFLLAGAFQFSSLKYACLDKCRTPLGFLVSRWQGRSRGLASFRIGWLHGLFCVGCCWALMMLMFAVGTASLGWMLILALVMGVEKNAPWGRRISRPLGVVLLVAGFAVGLYHFAR